MVFDPETEADPGAALAAAHSLDPAWLLGVCLPSSGRDLTALATRLGFDQVVGLVDPALSSSSAGPRERGQALAALLSSQRPDVVLIDGGADLDEGLLAASIAHHLDVAVLLRVLAVAAADAPGAVEVRLRVSGRLHRLRVAFPTVLSLSATIAAPAPAAAPAQGKREPHVEIKTLADLGLQPDDLIEPSPPSTFSAVTTRPTPVSDLSQLLAAPERER